MPVTLNANSSTGFIATSDTSGVLQLQTGGTTAVTVDASQNVGIGTASPAQKLHLAFAGGTYMQVQNTTASISSYFGTTTAGGTAQVAGAYPFSIFTNGSERLTVDSSGNVGIGTTSTANYILRVNAASPLFGMMVSGTQAFTIGALSGGGGAFYYGAGNAEAMRIDSSGNLLVGTTDAAPRNFTSGFGFQAGAGLFQVGSTSGSNYFNLTSASGTIIEFRRQAGTVGNISTNGSNCTFNSTSDYRLKENIAPMTGALAKVSALKPVTYKWKLTGIQDEGFIAHELAEVCPSAVTGEKDAVDAEGNPQYQGIDVSFLVATLTAAIQEMKAIIDTQASTITQLQADVAALKGASA